VQKKGTITNLLQADHGQALQYASQKGSCYSGSLKLFVVAIHWV
jgi:hypothetical protein